MMKTTGMQLAIEILKNTLSEVNDSVMKRVNGRKIKSRLEENVETVNSPISMILEFFIIEHNLEDDQGVCLSVVFQNHKPIVGGLQDRNSNELFAYADMSYLVGENLSNFGIVRLSTDASDYRQRLEEIVNCITLYFKSQVPVIVDKLNECEVSLQNRS